LHEGKSKLEGNRDRDKDKERDKDSREKYSCGVAKPSLRPPCAPESTLLKKMQRYFHWVNDPSLIPEDLHAYKAVVDKLHGELLELEMESIRWHANVNTVRAEYSNMESSLSSQVLEQEALEGELGALLLREFASVEEITKGDSLHGTRGKAALTPEDIAGRLANFDTVLTGQLETCLALAQPQGGEREGCQAAAGAGVVTDPQTGEVLVCSYQPKGKGKVEGKVKVEAGADARGLEKVDGPAPAPCLDAAEMKMKMEVEENQNDTVAEVMGSVIEDVMAGAGPEGSTPSPSSAPPPAAAAAAVPEAPELSAIVSYVEDKKRKIAELTEAGGGEIFGETLHQSHGRLFSLALPDEAERQHNYFKAKRLPGAVPLVGDRQRAEVEAQSAAVKYSAAPLSAYMSLLQHPYKAGALEGLGQQTSPLLPPSSSAGGSSKGRSRGGGKAAAGGASSSSSSEAAAAVAMCMDALRRPPCEVPLVLSTFSRLEGWYAGTFDPLQYPFHGQQPGAGPGPGATSASDQEHFKHPQFVQVGEKYVSDINTLSSATRRAQIELADLEKEEAEWKAQVGNVVFVEASPCLFGIHLNSNGACVVDVTAGCRSAPAAWLFRRRRRR
jgi:hypothetical protein